MSLQQMVSRRLHLSAGACRRRARRSREAQSSCCQRPAEAQTPRLHGLVQASSRDVLLSLDRLRLVSLLCCLAEAGKHGAW